VALVNLPDGWLTEPEAKELQRVCAGAVVLELGAYKGRSTVAIAQVAKHVVSVDRHQGIPGHDPDSLPDYLAAVRGLENVSIVVARFEEFVPLIVRSTFDVVFIDGDHDATSVERDIMLTSRQLTATFAFHDFDFPEVRDTVTRLFKCAPDWLVGSLAVYDGPRLPL
jgi:hypothetical protein